MIDYIFWNSIKNKPHDHKLKWVTTQCDAASQTIQLITDVIAEPNDIVDYLDGVLFLCQRKDDNNNCVCFRLENSNIPIKQTLVVFALNLYAKHNIQVIRLESKCGRYRFLTRLYPKEVIIQNKEIKARDVFYINCQELWRIEIENV